MSRRTPRALDELPAHTVRRLGPPGADALRGWAQAAGHRVVEADLRGCKGKKAVLLALGRALQLPRWYGANLDALFDCLTDLPETAAAPGYLVLLRGLSEAGLDAEQRAALLEVFRDAAPPFAERGVALRVLYD